MDLIRHVQIETDKLRQIYLKYRTVWNSQLTKLLSFLENTILERYWDYQLRNCLILSIWHRNKFSYSVCNSFSFSVDLTRVNWKFDKERQTANSCLNRNSYKNRSEYEEPKNMNTPAREAGTPLILRKKPALMPRKPVLFRILLIALNMRHDFTQIVFD